MSSNPTKSSELVVFIHSTGTGRGMWKSVPDSAVAGRRTIAPANLGYPPNPPVARGEVLDADDDAREMLRALAVASEESGEVERVHLIAHSYGGVVALHLLERLGDRVASAVLYEPVVFGTLARAAPGEADPAAVAEAQAFIAEGSFTGDEEHGGRAAWLEQFIDYWNRPGSWSKMPDAAREQQLALGWKMFQEVRACFSEATPFVEWKLPSALTVLVGERSPQASRAMALALAQSRPNAVVVDLPGIGHMGAITHAPTIHAEIARHFARLDGGGGR